MGFTNRLWSAFVFPPKLGGPGCSQDGLRFAAAAFVAALHADGGLVLFVGWLWRIFTSGRELSGMTSDGNKGL